jgi:hypothetical protein
VYGIYPARVLRREDELLIDVHTVIHNRYLSAVRIVRLSVATAIRVAGKRSLRARPSPQCSQSREPQQPERFGARSRIILSFSTAATDSIGSLCAKAAEGVRWFMALTSDAQ